MHENDADILKGAEESVNHYEAIQRAIEMVYEGAEVDAIRDETKLSDHDIAWSLKEASKHMDDRQRAWHLKEAAKRLTNYY